MLFLIKKNEMNFDVINKCPVLRNIPGEDLQTLFQNIHFNTKEFEKEIKIIEAGAECNNLMILLFGEVRGEMIDFEGNPVRVENIAAPKPIAPAFLFGKDNKMPVSVIANTKCRILFIQKNQVLKMMQDNVMILQNYLNIISSRGQFLSRKVRLLSFKSLREKIAYFVLVFQDFEKEKIKSQQELADLLGVTRPALTRALIKLEKEKILTFKKGVFEILNESKLDEYFQKY